MGRVVRVGGAIAVVVVVVVVERIVEVLDGRDCVDRLTVVG